MRIEIIYICMTVGGILINSMELKPGQVNLLQTEPKSSDIRSHKTNKTPEVLIFNDFGRYSCGGRTRTCDLQVMSLASYQLLHSAM